MYKNKIVALFFVLSLMSSNAMIFCGQSKFNYLLGGIVHSGVALFCGKKLFDMMTDEYGTSSWGELRSEYTDAEGRKVSKERKFSHSDKKSFFKHMIDSPSEAWVPGVVFLTVCVNIYFAYKRFKSFAKIPKIKLPKLDLIKNKGSKIFKIGKQYA